MSYHNLTLKDIAAYTQNAISTVGTWKNGRLPASGDALARLAEIFQVSEEFLLYGRSRARVPDNSQISNQILNDIEMLMNELEGGNNERQNCVEEPPQSLRKSSPPPSEERRKLEAYFSSFLEEAERHPDGLAHVWYQLRREFPQDLFQQLRP